MNDSAGGMSSAATDALQAAFESEAQSIRQARNRSPKQGEGSKQMASDGGGGGQTGPVEGMAGGAGQATGGPDEPGEFGFDDIQVDWGRLPPRVARDLRQSLQEGMSAEFRSQVNAYFKLIAEQSSR